MGDAISSANPASLVASEDSIVLVNHARRQPKHLPGQLALPSPEDEFSYRSGHDEDIGNAGPLIQTPSSYFLHNPLPDAVLLPAPATPEEMRDGHAARYNMPFPPDIGGMTSKHTQTLDISLPTLERVKAPRNLRLPPFDILGIAVPHPDQIRSVPGQIVPDLGAGPLSKPEDPLHELSPFLERSGKKIALDNYRGRGSLPESEPTTNVNKKTTHNIISTFSPPDECPSIDWASAEKICAATGPDPPPMTDNEFESQQTPTQSSSTTFFRPAMMLSTATEPIDVPEWLKNVINMMMESLETTGIAGTTLKVLSHALPCPAPAGNAFPSIINALQQRLLPESTVWINVFHAVPGRFNMSDLSTSPPVTPGPAVGGEDYFTSTVFDSAVPVLDYQNETTKLHPSPNPAVPPETVHLSIVERYIPPTNSCEFSEMFSAAGRSILVDRLVELNPGTGTLIFIYPTRAGGETFAQHYLGPLLDPILRSMTVVNGLSSDLAANLGPIDCVKDLYDFESMKTNLGLLCRRISRGSSASSLGRYGSNKATYELAYSAKEAVFPNRKVWSGDWWVRQEKARVRAAVTRYFRISRQLPADTDIVPTKLIQEVLDGVATKEHPAGERPEVGIEIGVFVVKRTA